MKTILEINNKKFNKKLKGYDVVEVNKFKDEVCTFVSSMKKETDRLKDELVSKEQELIQTKTDMEELKKKAENIELAIQKQDDITKELEQEKNSMFRRLEKHLTQIEILKRENSQLEAIKEKFTNEIKDLTFEKDKYLELSNSLKADLEKSRHEYNESLIKLEELTKQEDSIKEVLFIAKKTSDEIIRNAHLEAATIVEEAKHHEIEISNRLKAIESIISKTKKDFLDIVNYHSTAFENEIRKIEASMEEFKGYFNK